MHCLVQTLRETIRNWGILSPILCAQVLGTIVFDLPIYNSESAIIVEHLYIRCVPNYLGT